MLTRTMSTGLLAVRASGRRGMTPSPALLSRACDDGGRWQRALGPSSLDSPRDCVALRLHRLRVHRPCRCRSHAAPVAHTGGKAWSDGHGNGDGDGDGVWSIRWSWMDGVIMDGVGSDVNAGGIRFFLGLRPRVRCKRVERQLQLCRCGMSLMIATCSPRLQGLGVLACHSLV